MEYCTIYWATVICSTYKPRRGKLCYGEVNAFPQPKTILQSREQLLVYNNVIDFLHCRYGTKFVDEYQSIMTRKLGLNKYNKQLISKLLNNLAVDKVDYTNFFRLLSNVKADRDIPENELLVPLMAALLDIGKERKEAWISWVQTYIEEVCVFLVVVPPISYKHKVLSYCHTCT